MLAKIKHILNLQNILLYIGIASGGMALPTFMSTIIGIDSWLVLVMFFCVFVILHYRKKSRISNSYISYITILFVALCFVVLSSGLTLGTALSCVILLLSVYAAYIVNPKYLYQRYLNIVFVISMFSLLFFIPQFLGGIDIYKPFFSYLFPSYSSGEIYSYGGFIYRFVFLHESRNCGPFGEPGQYQCILCVAIYLSLFMKNTGLSEKRRLFFSLVFIATLITTQSTSGYIALGAIVLAFVFSKRKFSTKYQKYFLLSIAFMMLVFVLSGMWESFIRATITEKLMGDANRLSLSESSGGARTQSIDGVINLMIKDPVVLWGIGYDELADKGIEGCSGLLAILLAIGIVPFSILWGYPIAKKLCYNSGLIDIFLSFFIVVNMGLGQPHILNTSLFFMLFYGWFNKEKL